MAEDVEFRALTLGVGKYTKFPPLLRLCLLGGFMRSLFLFNPDRGSNDRPMEEPIRVQLGEPELSGSYEIPRETPLQLRYRKAHPSMDEDS